MSTKTNTSATSGTIVRTDEPDYSALRVKLASATTTSEALAIIGDVQHEGAALARRTFETMLTLQRIAGETIAAAALLAVKVKGETPPAEPMTWAECVKALGWDKATVVNGRAYSTLAEDWAIARYCSDTYRSGWESHVKAHAADANVPSDAKATVRGFLTYSRRAATHKGEGETGARALGAKAAREAAEAAAVKAAEDRRKKALADEDRASTLVAHVIEHPSANLVPMVTLTCSEVSSLTVETIDTLVTALGDWRAHVKATAEDKTDEAVIVPDEVASPAEAAHVAEGDEDVRAMLAALASKLGLTVS